MDQQGGADQRNSNAPGPSRGGSAVSTSTLGSAVVLLVIFISAMLLARNGSLFGTTPGQSSQGLATETMAATPTGPESSTTPSNAAEPSPTAAPSMQPEATLHGEIPGPDASVPPGVKTIPGLQVEALVRAWGSLGVTCESHSGNFAGAEGGYNIHCDRSDPKANIEISGDAVYWSFEGVQTVSVTVTALSGDIGGDVVANLLLPTAELAGGTSARRWVEDRIGDPSCAKDCVDVIDGTTFAISVGNGNAHQMHILVQP